MNIIQISEREKEILLLSTLPYKEMSKRLCVSIPTINTHISHILNKNPEYTSRHSILIEAIKQGLININDVITE